MVVKNLVLFWGQDYCHPLFDCLVVIDVYGHSADGGEKCEVMPLVDKDPAVYEVVAKLEPNIQVEAGFSNVLNLIFFFGIIFLVQNWRRP